MRITSLAIPHELDFDTSKHFSGSGTKELNNQHVAVWM